MTLCRALAGGVGALAAAALASGPAQAQGIPSLRGSIGAEYSRLHDTGGTGSGNLWSGTGDVVAPLGLSGIHLQGNLRVDHSDGSLPGRTNWDVAGAVFWRGALGAFGAGVGYLTTSGGPDFDFTHYGIFGEAYLADQFTLVARGGLFDGSGFTGEYYGGGLRFYALPNLSVTGRADVTDVDGTGNVIDYSVMGEYLLGWYLPMVLYGGYTYTDIPGTPGHLNIYSVGLRVLLGDESVSLLAQDRGGPIRNLHMPLKSLGL